MDFVFGLEKYSLKDSVNINLRVYDTKNKSEQIIWGRDLIGKSEVITDTPNEKILRVYTARLANTKQILKELILWIHYFTW